MFSKPIMIAASVAATNATLMAVGTTTLTTSNAFSDATGCGLCLSMIHGTASRPAYVMGNAATSATSYFYGTLTAWVKVVVTGDSITGDACCGEATTQETGATTAFCGKANVAYDASGTKKHNPLSLGATDFFQSALAQCPHNTTNCTYVGKKTGTAGAAITATDQRYIKLEDKGSTATLKMLIVASAGRGAAPAMLQRQGDVCTWVVETKCDAPVLTVMSTSAALTAGSGIEWSIQVLEWDEEFLSATTWLASAQVGGGTDKNYPPLTAGKGNTKIVDLSSETVDISTPNNLMGDVSFKTPVTTGTAYLSVPGNTLVAWMANIDAVYTSYKAEVVKYDAERAIWDKFAKYSAPAPGLFDWLFGATEDPDKPAAASSPLKPTQPVAIPATIKSLGLSDTSATKSPSMAEYKDTRGYGYPSAYTLVPVKSNTVKPFGTLAGAGILKDTAVAAVAADSLMSVRKTANYDVTGATAITSCKKSYLMITGVLNVYSAVKNVELVVTTSGWAKSLEQQIPVQPGAVTNPEAAPAGASQLAASAVAAALTALYLF